MTRRRRLPQAPQQRRHPGVRALLPSTGRLGQTVITWPPDETGALTMALDVLDPALLLNANDRRHWAEQGRITRYWRTLAAAAGGSAIRTRKWAPLTRAQVTVIVSWTDRHRRDPANWHPTGKALLDGLVDAGLLPDDDATRVVGPDMRGLLGQDIPMLTVVVTPLEETPS